VVEVVEYDRRINVTERHHAEEVGDLVHRMYTLYINDLFTTIRTIIIWEKAEWLG